MHGVVIHKRPVSLQVELAECQNSQSNERHSEDQAEQGVGGATTFCNTMERLENKL